MIHRPGGFDRLKVENAELSELDSGQVRVKTKAVGVNYADCVLRMGYYASAKEYVGWPITPGFEFSGTVEEVGSDVTDLAVGEKVFGVTRFDAYATHVAVPRHQIFCLPAEISFEQAACFPVIFLTAYYALHMIFRIFPDSIILIHSAAGGVGSALVQLCKVAGWQTIGVVGSSNKVQAVKELGADHVIDKSTEDLWKRVERYAPDGVDAILDGNGPPTLKEGYKHLRPSGKMIAYGFHSMFPRAGGRANRIKLIFDYLRIPRFHPVAPRNQNKALATFNLSFLFDRTDLLGEAMGALYPLLKEGKIRVPKVTTYPFREVARAHRDLQSGRTVGKLVLLAE